MVLHRFSRISARRAPLAIISKVRFSAASSASARFRSSISVFVPYHLMISPESSRSGSARKRNHRYSPSKRLTRPSISPGCSEASSACHLPITPPNHQDERRPSIPAAQLFSRKTRVVVPSPVSELDGTVRQTGPCHRGDRVDHGSVSIFGIVHFTECAVTNERLA